MKRFVLLLVCVLLLHSQTGYVAVHSISDVTGDGATHQLFTSGSASWVQFIALGANTAVVRVGESAAVSCSVRGLPVAAGFGMMYPPIPSEPREAVSGVHLYDLSQIYYCAATGDKFSVVWAK
jgi:hypothetical protein